MNLTIKDLEIAKELSHEERAAVRGGSIAQYGSAQIVHAGALLSLGSPVLAVQANPQSANENTVNMNTVFGSVGTLIGQFKA